MLTAQKIKIKRVDPYKDLPKEQRKKMVRLMKTAKFKGKVPRTVQQSIPYKQIWKDGLVQVDDNHFNRCIEFFDLNYKLASDDDKSAMFDNWCKFLNYFDSSVSLQFCFINKRTEVEELYKQAQIEAKNDCMDSLRKEYSDILKNVLERSNNGLIKKKFLIYTIEAESAAEASDKLERMEIEIINNLDKQLEVKAFPQNGYQRLETMFDMLNMDTDRKLNFNWNLLVKTGLTTKDFICPSSLTFKSKRSFEMEETSGRASSLFITAADLSDEILTEMLNTDYPLTVSIHINAVDQAKALKMAKTELADINGMISAKQKKAGNQGVYGDVISYDFKVYKEEAEEFIDDLQSRNERMFMVTIINCDFAKEEKDVEQHYEMQKRKMQKYNCELTPLDWRQEQGLMSSLPLGVDKVKNERVLTTTSTAIFIPFETQELVTKEGLFYGKNAISQNIITIDRKEALNPNGLILGTPGAGKGMSAKSEIASVVLCTDDDILIIDPEREYTPLVEAMGGQVIRLSADSPHHINPMDISFETNDEDKDYNPISSKCEFIQSFCEQIFDGKRSLEPSEKSIIDRCALKIYKNMNHNIKKENMPTLKDLYDLLLKQKEPEARNIALGLERFITGSLNVFNNVTNVNINNRIVCFDIKDLGKQLEKIGMLVVQDQVWNRVTKNRAKNKTTRYYIDEFHLLLGEELTATAAAVMWKRFRKWGGIPTGITQNVKDFLSSSEVENIFENSDFKLLLNQAPGDQRILAQALKISPNQMSYVNNSPPGQGLIIFRGTNVPFSNQIPKDTELYRLMTTKPDEMIQV